MASDFLFDPLGIFFFDDDENDKYVYIYIYINMYTYIYLIPLPQSINPFINPRGRSLGSAETKVRRSWMASALAWSQERWPELGRIRRGLAAWKLLQDLGDLGTLGMG